MKTKTYVVTGSASGIGKALVTRLAENNIVFAGYRNKEHEVDLSLMSPNIYPFYVDYTKPETIKEAADYILGKCTKIDTLVNIAGCVVAGPMECIDIDELKRQFSVNVFGHIDLTQRLVPILEGGKVINISSMASYGIFPYIAPYCASKKCLDMLFNSFYIENKKDIKVVSVKPGVIATPLWSKSVNENSKYFEKYGEYAGEMEYIIANARKNEKTGLCVDKVVDAILKADRAQNPKYTYTVGGDALFARILSKLPQGLTNNIIRLGIKIKSKRKN